MAGMLGISVYILADTYFISVYSGADGLAVLNLILPVYGLIYAIGAMIGIGSVSYTHLQYSDSWRFFTSPVSSYSRNSRIK